MIQCSEVFRNHVENAAVGQLFGAPAGGREQEFGAIALDIGRPKEVGPGEPPEFQSHDLFISGHVETELIHDAVGWTGVGYIRPRSGATARQRRGPRDGSQ